MSIQPFIFSTVPTDGAALTYAFAPFFMALVVGVCLCVLALAFVIGLHDSGAFARRKKRPIASPLSAPELSSVA